MRRLGWWITPLMVGCAAAVPRPDAGVEDAGVSEARREQALYFESLDPLGVATLYRVDLADGGPPVRLPGPLHGARPSVSPDGGVVLFHAADPMDAVGTPVVWALELPAGTSRLLSPDVSQVELEASFSPDGTSVLLTSQRDDPGGDIVRAEFHEGALRNRQNLTATSRTPDRTPAWSPDGMHIAFTAYRSGQPRLWVMTRDGHDAHEVTPSSGDWGDFSPDWSPDGQRLVFQRVGRQDTRLAFVSLDGGEVVVLERPGRRTYDGRFSADGTRLAAWERSDAGDDVVVLSLDGGVLRVIDTGGSDRHPSWR